MTNLEQLVTLRDLLRDKEKTLLAQRKLNDEIEVKQQKKKIDYSRYTKYNKKTSNLKQLFLYLSIIFSGYIIYRLLPLYGELFENQLEYTYYELWVYIVVIFSFFITTMGIIKNFKKFNNDSILIVAKKQYNYAAYPTLISVIVFLLFLGLGIASLFREPSEIFDAKNDEIFNASIINITVIYAYITSINLFMIISTPIRKIIYIISPGFISLKSKIRRQESGENKANKKEISTKKAYTELLEKKIKEINVIVDEFKTLDIVNIMIRVLNKNPEAPLRYALNCGILETQTSEYRQLIDKQIKEANRSIERYNDIVENKKIEINAHVKVYNQEIRDNNMRLSYLRDKQVEEIKKRIRR